MRLATTVRLQLLQMAAAPTLRNTRIATGNCLNDANSNNICDEYEEEGCTDPFACNFNSNATIDNGSCESISCAGCTDSVACNYDQDAVINNGSCDYTSCIGCTDGTACNYDAAATVSSGECTYPLPCAIRRLQWRLLGGCQPERPVRPPRSGWVHQHADACNYDADANVDDGSCDLTSCQGMLGR